MTDDNFSNWQEAWEAEAQQSASAYTNYSDQELLTEIQAGRFGEFYVIWQEIARRQNAPLFLNPLNQIIANPNLDSLIKQHTQETVNSLLNL